MGLDISYYRRLVLCEPGQGYGAVIAVANEDAFTDRAAPLMNGCEYAGEFVGGFRAGSYSGYSMWREQLARLAGYPAMNVGVGNAAAFDSYAQAYPHASAAWMLPTPRDMPFYPLINFTDCDGVIGSDAARRLAQDFAAHQDVADSHPDEYFRTKYREWRTAFETASDDGAVVLH